ncbi:MAG: Na/Pi cotransporter family protein [Bacillota bacterium]
MEILFIIIGLLGGLGLFLYGMNIASEALQKSSAKNFKEIFTKITKSPLKGLAFGVVFTFLLQGSSASSVLLVGFVSAGLMPFANALTVIMGGAIGTTLTVQLIAFKITDYALLLVAVGALTSIFLKNRKVRYAGQILLGFGLVFYGMGLMSAVMSPLKNYEGFITVMVELAGRPVFALIVSTIFTAVIQSSAATLALAISLAAQGVISIEAAMPLMLGANIGTTATALLSCLACSREAKRVALAHFLFKFIGALLVLPFLSLFTQLVLVSSVDVSRQIANAHTLYNLIITGIFFPFISWFSLLIYKIFPERQEELDEERTLVKYLDNAAVEVPEIALWQTKNEIINMGSIVEHKMLPGLENFFKLADRHILRDLENREQQVDNLYVAISKYITSVASRDLTEDQSQEQVKYLYVINDLEHLGDIVISLAIEYNKVLEDGTHFSSHDLKDFYAMFAEIKENFHTSLKAFAENDLDMAARVIKGQPEILRMEKRLRFNHFARLASEDKKDISSSSAYLDMLNDLLRMNLHSVSISQTVMGMV